MTLFASYTYLGGYGPISSVVAPADPEEKAKASEPLDRNGMAFAYPQIGFGKAPPPSDLVFWAMRRYPTCELAYAVTAGPVMAGTRTATIRNADDATTTVPTGVGVQVTQTQDEKRRKLVEDVFEDQWSDILHGLEALNFGRWTQETIWGRAYDVIAPVRFKSFLPWEVQLMRDRFNDFAGFQVYGKGDEGKRGAPYAFHYVSQPQFDPIFGVPRAESARESWYRATQCHENGDRIERKASGIQMYLGLPTGMSWRDSTGNTITSAAAVQTIVNSAASGATFTIPSFWTKEDIRNKPELAGIDPVKIQEFDWGDTGPSLLASIARLDRLDKEIFRAWHRPEREAMEGEHGTKAEAGVHGQVGIIDSEKVHSDFLCQFNKQVVDRFLVTNFGPEAAGSIYFKPTPLVDAQQAFKQDVVKALLASPTEGPTMAANIDGRKLMKETELSLKPEDAVIEPQPMPQQDPNADPMALSADDILALNCGTGAGGFQSGNKCAGDGAGESVKKNSRPARLTDAERGAIEDYSGDKFQEINSQLRNGELDNGNKKIVERLDSAIEKLPKHQGVLHRSFTVPPEHFDAFSEKYGKGKVVSDPAYMSASTNLRRFTQTKNTVVLKMRNTDGVDVSGTSLNPGEKEVLIPRGKKMRVLDTKIGDGGELLVLMEGA